MRQHSIALASVANLLPGVFPSPANSSKVTPTWVVPQGDQAASSSRSNASSRNGDGTAGS
jgi:hypothetical protein